MIKALGIGTKSVSVESFSIFLVWLFHISGIIGISLGYQEWFVRKTPLNLVVVLALLIVNYPITSVRRVALTFFFFLVGMLVEWVGVHYGFPFGEYSYGNTLGYKMDGIPYLIGVNWAILILITGACTNHLSPNPIAKVFIGATLMVLLDFFIESAAPVFDFWTFSGLVAPLRNYVAWFIVSLVLHSVYQSYHLTGNTRFSFHALAAYFLFFIYFYVFYRI
jgi:uncharacterized membrane protein